MVPTCSWLRPAGLESEALPDCSSVSIEGWGTEARLVVWRTDEEYNPLSEPNLSTYFSRIRTCEDAKSFAAAWGPLGYASLIPEGKDIMGEPLSWLLAQARTVDLATHLAEGLGTGEKGLDRLEATLRQAFREQVDRLTGRRWVLTYAARHELKHELFSTEPVYRDPSLARRLLIIMVNANLATVRPRLEMRELDPDKRPIEVFGDESPAATTLRFSVVINTLIEAVWWQVAEWAAWAATEDRLRVCEECGSIFQATDRRQRFCPPRSDWVERNRKLGLPPPESPCAVRHRQRRWQQRQREKQGKKGENQNGESS